MTTTNPVTSHTHTVSGKRTSAAGGHSHGLTAPGNSGINGASDGSNAGALQ